MGFLSDLKVDINNTECRTKDKPNPYKDKPNPYKKKPNPYEIEGSRESGNLLDTSLEDDEGR